MAVASNLTAQTLTLGGEPRTTWPSGGGVVPGATGTRNQAANDLFDGLVTIQNAAGLQFPNDVAIRAEFRLNTFPPKDKGGKGSPRSERGKQPPANPSPTTPVP